MSPPSKEERAFRAAEKLRLRRLKYVRVTDENGDLWTIPPNSTLHLALQVDEDEGAKLHVVPAMFCRDPHLPLAEYDIESQLIRLEHLFNGAGTEELRREIAARLSRIREWAGFVGRTYARERIAASANA